MVKKSLSDAPECHRTNDPTAGKGKGPPCPWCGSERQQYSSGRIGAYCAKCERVRIKGYQKSSHGRKVHNRAARAWWRKKRGLPIERWRRD